jgi:hypothetical protein
MLSKNPAQLRQKAEACRQLADTAENVVRNAMWLDRADYWEKLAKEAEGLVQAANGPNLLPPHAAPPVQPGS